MELLEENRRRAIRADLVAWCEHALAPLGQTPARHHRLMLRELADLADGKSDRLMILMPPGSAKTRYASELFPAWFLARAPRQEVIGASYNAVRAEDVSGRVQALIREHSDVLGYGLTNDGKGLWYTNTSGSYRAAGVGGGITGRRADLVVIDDPISGRADAESERIREILWGWYTAEVTTRLKPGGRIVLIQTRWHQDDLAGRLLAADRSGKEWRVISLPALAERNDPLKRKIGEPLWPEWEDTQALARKRKAIGEYEWSALFQQSPTIAGGGIIKRHWWLQWPPVGDEASWQKMRTESNGAQVQVQVFPVFSNTIVSVDTAYTEREESDWSGCTAWGVFADRGNRPRTMMVEAWRDRLELHALAWRIIETCRRRKATTLLIEAKGSGLSVAQEVQRLMRAEEWQTVTIDPGRADKVARMHAVTPLFVGGCVYAPVRPWADMVIDEVCAVPRGKYDDLADTVTQALSYMRRVGLAQLSAEAEADEYSALLFKGRSDRANIADSYGV